MNIEMIRFWLNETQTQDAYEVVNGKHATEGVARRIGDMVRHGRRSNAWCTTTMK